MIDFYRHRGWTIIGPVLPHDDRLATPAVTLTVIDEQGPLRLNTWWIPLGDPFWNEAERMDPGEITEALGDGWKVMIADQLLRLISPLMETALDRDRSAIQDAVDEIIAWAIDRRPVMTVKEAEEVWQVSGLRARLREKSFLPNEYWRSGGAWMLRTSGLFRRYGWPRSLKTE